MDAVYIREPRSENISERRATQTLEGTRVLQLPHEGGVELWTLVLKADDVHIHLTGEPALWVDAETIRQTLKRQRHDNLTKHRLRQQLGILA